MVEAHIETASVKPDDQFLGQFVISFEARKPTAREYLRFLNKSDENTKNLFIRISELGSFEKTVAYLEVDLDSEIGLSWKNESELKTLAEKYNQFVKESLKD